MFRTELLVKPSLEKITLKDSILTLGSCFADAMGKQLNDFKFQVSANPFGTLYNPISIHQLILLAAQNAAISENSYLKNNDLYANYLFHSNFTSLEKEDLTLRIRDSLAATHEIIAKASVLNITYGTAWVYRRNDTNEVVANCHKMPGNLFTKSLLSQSEIVDSFAELQKVVRKFNPTIRFIITVSPVRHVKDTLELNAVSKAVLRSACHEIETQFKYVSYFPSYEIMMDDLRDYRFYKSDMLHPSEEAEEYIWQKFSSCYFDKETLEFLLKWKDIRSALAHRAFHPTSHQHQEFLKATLQKVNELKDLVNVEDEISEIKSQIINLKS